jgi:hypothetical protein
VTRRMVLLLLASLTAGAWTHGSQTGAPVVDDSNVPVVDDNGIQVVGS